jgi:hypothetical protein
MRKGRELYPSRRNTASNANDVGTQVLRDPLTLAATRFVVLTTFGILAPSFVPASVLKPGELSLELADDREDCRRKGAVVIARLQPCELSADVAIAGDFGFHVIHGQ